MNAPRREEVEHYDLRSDPFELQNLFPAPAGTVRASQERELAARLARLEDCAGIRGRDPRPAAGHLPWDGSFVSQWWTADTLIARAREERCCLEHYWEQAALLPHFEQLKVARALEAIEPARMPGTGHRCEPKWRFSLSARKRVKEAKQRDNGSSIQSAKTLPQKPLEQAERVTLQRGGRLRGVR